MITDYTVPNKLIANVATEGGADEIWFNPGDNHYLMGDTTCKLPVSTTGCLGVIDALSSPPSGDSVAGTAPGSHSVTADSVTNEVYVPIRGNNGTTPPSTGTSAGAVCSTAKDAFGIAGNDGNGCILSYIAPTDSDDHPAKHASR